MRMKDYAERDGKRVWLDEEEIGMLLENFRDTPQEVAASTLLGRCGLRRQEVTQVTPADLVSTGHGRIVRVWEGKRSKYREVFAPDQLVDIVLGMQLDADDPIVDVDTRTVYSWVARAAKKCHEMNGDVGWLSVGPHDLRRSFGVRLLESGVSPAVVMDQMGIDNYGVFKAHYLSEFSSSALRKERGKVSWLGGTPVETEHDPLDRRSFKVR